MHDGIGAVLMRAARACEKDCSDAHGASALDVVDPVVSHHYGVMRRDFAFPTREFEIYTPLTFDPEELVNRRNYSYLAVARLRPGISVEQAQAELSALAWQIEREHPKTNEGIGAEVAPMLADTIAAVRTPLYVLLAAVAAMLLIGCANLANLLLARALVRQRELAVRAALGAARGRLIRQSITELVPILAAGGALGVLAAAWTIDAVVPLLPADLPRVENVGLHLPVLLVSAATLALIALFAGIWPALEAARGGLAASVANLSRGGTGSARRTRLRVQWAVDGGRLEAGTVHVAPPNHHVVFKADGTLLLVQSPRIHYSRPSVDMLFASAAQAFGSRTLAIILTGTGNDGSDGVPVVHRHGGVVIAQDEASSQFFSMPREAIESGAVSFVLPLSAIAPEICRLVALGVAGGGVGGTPAAN